MKRSGFEVLHWTAAALGCAALGVGGLRADSGLAADIAVGGGRAGSPPVAQLAGPQAAPAGARVRELVFPQVLGGAVILHDNGPIVTHPGGGAGGLDASHLQSAIGLNVYGFGHSVSTGFRVADDFEVTAAQGWDVTTISFFAYQTGSPTTSTIDNVNLRIWDGLPGDPGSTVVFGDPTTNRLSTTQFMDVYRVLDTDPAGTSRPVMEVSATAGVHLDPGTYWLDWQTGGTLASGPWAVPISIVGTATTGDGLQFNPTGATWSPVIDNGTAAAPQGFPFVIYGILDQMPFLADFEEGDFSEWSATQP
ncbi:MAG: hypothetical protein F9K16_03380 [Thermoanaerobaculia bacterium]|nr:MAG: hypothetical protein F9K16_03380 [Thermoanaerobaculia bacterium]MBZ0103358.1 hypothetical protein [Thermoanaerobaculia bacterium]